ncbi:MAG: hypothetical protein AAAB20_11495 [Rhizobium sp.]|uniref:hypothetical protein n=1 Tax=Rhizobium sp. TaxID=391 RepID=UPI0012E038D2
MPPAARICDLAFGPALNLSGIGFAHCGFLFVAQVIAAGRGPADEIDFERKGLPDANGREAKLDWQTRRSNLIRHCVQSKFQGRLSTDKKGRGESTYFPRVNEG